MMQSHRLRLALLSVALGALAARSGAGEAANKAVIEGAGEHRWEDSPAMKGARSATLWGDPKTGAYGALRQVAAGTVLPLHTHSLEQRVVMVSGSITLTIEGIPGRTLGPGAYAFIPAGVKHSARCGAGADCVYLEQQPGKADLILVKGPDTKK